VTEQGREATDRYAHFRRELLLTLTGAISTDNSLTGVGRVLNLMAGMHDQAACIAAAHRIST
jgi:predicted MarR family transcription regulator